MLLVEDDPIIEVRESAIETYDTALPRQGLPPLTLIGRCLVDLCRSDAGTTAAIVLWAKAGGGYCLGWTEDVCGEIHRRATTLDSLSDIMDHLEDLCAMQSLAKIYDPQELSGAQGDLQSFLSRLHRRACFRRNFNTIASQVLCRLDTLTLQ